MDRNKSKKIFTAEEVLKILSEDNYLTISESSSSSNLTTHSDDGTITYNNCSDHYSDGNDNIIQPSLKRIKTDTRNR